MKRRLIFSPLAEQDLDGILSFIARDKPGAASRFVARLRKYCLPLADNPFIGEECNNLRPRTRRLTFEGYLIFFRIDADEVEVTRVIHGARDWVTLFR